MRRASLFAVVAFLAGLGIGFLGRSPDTRKLQPMDTRAADLAAIEKLHQEDIAATLSQDPNLLVDIWTEDGVRLGDDRPATVGKKAIRAENEKAPAGLTILSYVPEIKELQIGDGWAFEWGYFEANYKLSPEGEPLSYRAKILRVLMRQSGGSWKFARVMSNAAEQQ